MTMILRKTLVISVQEDLEDDVLANLSNQIEEIIDLLDLLNIVKVTISRHLTHTEFKGLRLTIEES